MNANEMPEALQPKALAETVTNAVKLPAVAGRNRRSIARALKRAGFLQFDKKQLEACEQIGVNLDRAAMLTIARGGAYVAQQASVKILADLMRIAEASTDKAKVKMVPQLGYMITKLTNANKQMFEDGKIETEPVGNGKAAKPAQMFVPLQVNVNTSAPATVEKVVAVGGETGKDGG